jgi:chemotaxis protein CheC
MSDSLFEGDSIVSAAFHNMSKEGSQRAAESLSKLIGQKVNVDSFEVKSAPVERVAETIGPPDELVTSVALDMTGDAVGSMMLIFPQQSCYNIADLIMKRTLGTTQALNVEDESAIKEAGNIVSGSFLASISEYMGLNIIESVPDLSSDMLKATVDSVLARFAEKNLEEAIVFEVYFSMGTYSGDATTLVPAIKITTHFVLLFDAESIIEVIRKLKDAPGGKRTQSV